MSSSSSRGGVGQPPQNTRPFSPSPVYDIDNLKPDRVPGSVKDGRSVPLVGPSPSNRDSLAKRTTGSKMRVNRKLDFPTKNTTSASSSSISKLGGGKQNGHHQMILNEATEDTNEPVIDSPPSRGDSAEEPEIEVPEQQYEVEMDQQMAKLVLEQPSEAPTPNSITAENLVTAAHLHITAAQLHITTATEPSSPSTSSSSSSSSVQPVIPLTPSLAAGLPASSSPTNPSVSSSLTAAAVVNKVTRSQSIAEEDDPSRKYQTRKYAHEDSFHPNWPKHKKHFFILSNAGKPIYSRYGDESGLSSVMGLLQAVISSVADGGDIIRHMLAGDLRIVFVLRGPFYLVCVSQSSGEPLSQLEQQLAYLYYQIIATLTAGIFRVYQNRSAFDVRHLLTGTERTLDSLIHRMNFDSQFLLDSIHCLRIPDYELRAAISARLQKAAHPELTFAMMMSHQKLISLVRPSKYTLSATDLHLLMNFVHSSASFRGQGESWAPFCLPQFNEKGFMWVYVVYVAPEVCLMLLSPRQDNFYHMSQCKKQITKGLQTSGLLERLVSSAVQRPFYSVKECGIEGLRHFLYKSKLISQFTCPAYEQPYNTKRQAKRLYRLYQQVRNRVVGPEQNSNSNINSTNSNFILHSHHKVYYFSSQSETILGWVTGGFELYATFSPMETKAVCIRACNSLLAWIKRCEDSLFVLSSPVF